MKTAPKPTKRVKRKKKTVTRTILKKQIHAVMREIAIINNPVCVCCGGDNILQGGHFIPVSTSRAARFELINVNTQCRACNHNHDVRKDFLTYTIWFMRYYGLEEMLRLHYRSKQRRKSDYTMNELRDILKDHEKTLADLK